MNAQKAEESKSGKNQVSTSAILEPTTPQLANMDKLRDLAKIYSIHFFDKGSSKSSPENQKKIDSLIKRMAGMQKARFVQYVKRGQDRNESRSSLGNNGTSFESTETCDNPYGSPKLPLIKQSRHALVVPSIRCSGPLAVTHKKPPQNALRHSMKLPPKALGTRNPVENYVYPNRRHKEYEKILRQHRRLMHCEANKSVLDGVVLERAREKIVDITSATMAEKLNRLSKRIETINVSGTKSNDKPPAAPPMKKKSEQKVHFAEVIAMIKEA